MKKGEQVGVVAFWECGWRALRRQVVGTGLLASILFLLGSFPGRTQVIQEFVWADSFAGTSNDTINALAVGPGGEVVSVGSFGQSLAIETNQFTSTGALDALVLKQTSDGSLAWVKVLTGASSEQAFGVAVGSAGEIYVAGTFTTTLTLETTNFTSNGGADVFVARLSADGALVWASALGTSQADSVTGLAIDNLGGVFITGVYRTNATFGTNVLPWAGAADLYVAKLDAANGDLVWARGGGSATNEVAGAVAADGQGGVFVAGSFRSNADFSGIVLSAAGFDDALLVRYRADGSVAWIRTAGGSSSDFGRAVAVDLATNVYFGGFFGGTFPIGTSNFTHSGAGDSFIASYSPAGTFAWARKIGGSSADTLRALAADPLGGVHAVGQFAGTTTLSGSNLTSSGADDVFVARYTAAGALSWALRGGGAGVDDGRAVAANSSGQVYLGGTYRGTASFGGNALIGVATNDAFVASVALIDLAGPPTVTVPPDTQVLVRGTDYTLTVQAKGAPPLSYAWYFQGAALSNATTTNLLLADAQFEDAGAYFAVVSNLFGTVTSRIAMITVVETEPPSIITQPVGTNVLAGTPTAFLVQATGTAPLRYQWAFNDNPLSGATQAVLSLANPQTGAQGAYLCVVTNAYGSVTSNPALLIVDTNSPPVVTLQPLPQSAFIGGTASFLVAARGVEPLSYQWWRDSAPLAGATTPSLVLPNAQTNQAGLYSVVISNAVGSTQSVAVGLQVSKSDWLWLTRGGGTGDSDRAPGVAVDAWGNTLAAAQYTGTITVDHLTLTNASTNATVADLAVVKLDATGAIRWAIRDGGTAVEQPQAIAVDLSGNVLVAGNVSGSSRLAGTQLASIGGIDAFLAKYSPAGAGIWARRFGGLATDVARGVAVDAAGHSVVVGEFLGTLSIDGHVLTTAGKADVFVLKLDRVGAVLWARRMGGTNYDQASAVSCDRAGNAYVTGTFQELASFGGQSLLAVGGTDVFTVKLSPDGEVIWARQAGGNSYEYARGVAADPIGNVFVGGWFQGEMITDTTNLTSAGSFDHFFLRYSADGTLSWARRAGGESGADQTFAVATDAHGNGYAIGSLVNNLDLAQTNIVAVGGNDALVASYSPSGLTRWARRGGASSTELPLAGAVGPAGHVAISGWFRGNTAFGSLTNVSAGSNDFFVAMLDTLEPASAPQFDFSPGDQEVFEFTEAVLASSAHGSLPLQYQWRFAGADVVGQTNPVLILSSAVLSNAGNYSVVVSNPLGSITSAPALLTVLPQTNPITIVAQPVPAVVAAGDTAQFSVTAFGAPPLRYQWWFEAAPLAGATNRALILSNVALANAGNYRVVVSNAFASVTSSNALLVVSGDLPFILTHPASQSVGEGSNVTFNVLAAGTPPLRYQWRFNGQNILRATNSALGLVSVQRSSAGAYSVVVSNSAGLAVSDNAFLQVVPAPTVFRLISGGAAAGSNLVVPIIMTARGKENGVGFSLQFDPVAFSFVSLTTPSNIPGTVLVNSSQSGSGRVGVALTLASAQAFLAGTHTLFELTLSVTGASNGSSDIFFADVPTIREVADPFAEVLPVVFIDGVLTSGPTNTSGPAEADVSPRPAGNGLITISDWVQVGRFVSRRDAATNAGEFQRADSSPRVFLGNGRLTPADWIQAGRYAVGLDTPVAAGGPEQPLPPPPPAFAAQSEALVARTLRLDAATLQPGATNRVRVLLDSLGAESGLGFTVEFSPLLTWVGAGAGADASTAALEVVSNAPNSLAVAIALPPGDSLAAGSLEVAWLDFRVPAGLEGSLPYTFTDAVVAREIADLNATAVAALFLDGALWSEFSFDHITDGYLHISRSGDHLKLSWPMNDSSMLLQSSTSVVPSVVWSVVVGSTNQSDGSNHVQVPLPAEYMFFRLLKP